MLNRNYIRNFLLLVGGLAGYSLLSGCVSQIKPLSSYPVITEPALVETYNKVAEENLKKNKHVDAYNNFAPIRKTSGIEKILGSCYSEIKEDILNTRIINSREANEFRQMYKELKNCGNKCNSIVQKVREDAKFCEERRYPDSRDFMDVYSENTLKLYMMIGDSVGVEKSMISWINQNHNAHRVIADIMKYYCNFKGEGMNLSDFEKAAREVARIDSMLGVNTINFSENAWLIAYALKDPQLMLMAWKSGKENDRKRAQEWDARAVELNQLMKKSRK